MPFRAQFQLVALGLGGTPDRRVELALPPGDFLYLDLNLLLPLDDLDLRLFRPDSLAGYGLLQEYANSASARRALTCLSYAAFSVWKSRSDSAISVSAAKRAACRSWSA